MTKKNSLYGILVVLLLWIIMHYALNSSFVPGPVETLATLFTLLKGKLLIHIGVSLYRIFFAVGASVLIGIPVGLWAGMNKKADAFISPVAYILYPIPKIAFLPIFMLLLGLGDMSKIVLIITIIVFQIILASRDGVKEIQQVLFFSVYSLGLSRLQVYRNLVFPAVLPKIFSALRISIGISISALFFSENFATTYGIGYFIMNSWAMVDYVEMFAGIVAMGIMGILIFRLLDMLERRLCPWMFLNEN